MIEISNELFLTKIEKVREQQKNNQKGKCTICRTCARTALTVFVKELALTFLR